MNKHGQALVEFVLILPVLLLLVFAFIDAGRMILCRNRLETNINDVRLMFKDNKSISEIETYLNNNSDYKIKVSIINDEYQKIILETKLNLITPGMSKIFDENIKVERSIINE